MIRAHHPLRHVRALRRRASILLLALAGVSTPGCRAEGPNPHPPDEMLRDSLGLTLDDRVHRVALVSRGGMESATPGQVVLRPGDYVEFVTGDRRVRTVSFFLDSLDAEQREFLRTTRQDRSPPLLELESRFVVSFDGAPTGRYPFVVEGNDLPATGALVVEPRGGP